MPLLTLVLACVIPAADVQSSASWDIVVYGGTSCGVVAAVQAARAGKSVIIVCPDKHLGGLTSGGLGWTDSGRKEVVGGLARTFYHRVWQHYEKPEAWKWQKRQEYGNRGQGTTAIDGDQRTMWIFEPHVAEQVFEEMIAEHKIPVRRDEWLDRDKGIAKDAGRLISITTLGGNTYRGRMFIDATYEGDLMATAGVSYHVGREATSVYGENFAGVQKDVRHHGHFFPSPISPYVVPGDAASGLLPRVHGDNPGANGQGDHRIQAYCFRMCLTTVPENRVAFPKPQGYDAKQYELLVRVLQSGWKDVFRKFDPIPNAKTDTNNHGPFSTDNIGMNYDYPEASYERRRQIIREHEVYQKGLMYFLANDARVPEPIRTEMSRWGLAKDEFVDNGNWPHQIYVREARRMIGPYVMTEQDCLSARQTPQPVGMGSYTMDSHNVQRYVTADGSVQNEGDIGVGTPQPYQISYLCIVPRKSECTNLLVPVCASSSHIAFGSIRMEPVFMILGESAATAAVLAIDAGSAIQDLPYDTLRRRLLADGQVLELPPDGHAKRPRRGIPASRLQGTVVDDIKAAFVGNWNHSGTIGPFVAAGYRHDGNDHKGQMSATFTAEVSPGRYQVRLACAASGNRASNVPVRVEHRGGSTKVIVNQRKTPTIDGAFVLLGTFDFDSTATVTLSNEGTDGYVIADAVQFFPAK